MSRQKVFFITTFFTLAGLLGGPVGSASADPFDFDGQADNARDDLGYYYMITGGKDPGVTYTDGNGDEWTVGSGGINGDNSSGGTFRFLLDEPSWGGYALGQWNKDDWFPENVSFALTLENDSSTVYDNNGILDGTYGNYYDATGLAASGDKPGLYRGFSMSNNYDWIYAGMFILGEETTFDSISGFFDENAGFDHTNPEVSFAMNIWSADPLTDGPGFVPVNTGGFLGDVFTTVATGDAYAGGTMTAQDSGVDRVFGSDYGNATDDILQLNYALDTAITLDPGVYFFSHNAIINAPVPEPASMTLLGLGLAGFAFRKLRKRA